MLKFPTPPAKGWIFHLQILGVPVYFHWTFPALAATGGFVAAMAAGNLRNALEVFLSASLAYLVLVIIHEGGHALAGKVVGIKISHIVISGAAGWCIAESKHSDLRNLIFHSGGLLAQAVVLLVTLLCVMVVGAPSGLILNCFVFVFTFINAISFLWNAVPIQGRNDGARMTATIRRLLAK